MKKLNSKQPFVPEEYYDELYGIIPEMWECAKPVLIKDGLPVGIIVFGTVHGKT